MTFSEYIENLAERHVDIRHKENDEVHFLSSEREKHTALDSVLHYPAVIVDRGSGFGYGGNPGAYRKDRDYLLFIVEHVSDTSDYEQIEAALDKCERILDELLNQILEDKRKKRLWLAFSLEDVEADYVVNNDNQLYGVVAAIHLSELYKVLNCRSPFPTRYVVPPEKVRIRLNVSGVSLWASLPSWKNPKFHSSLPRDTIRLGH